MIASSSPDAHFAQQRRYTGQAQSVTLSNVIVQRGEIIDSKYMVSSSRRKSR